MRHRAFPGSGPEVQERYNRAGQWLLATVYRSDKAMSWCKSNGVPVIKAAGETIDSAGGFVVPHELANAIIDIRENYGAFRRRARIVPMASDTTSFPRRTGGVTASFIGENSATTAGTAAFDQIGMTAKKITALVLMSSELDEDSIVDMVDTIANEMAWAFATKEDDCAFNGDGTSTYGHMRGIGSIVLDGFHTKAKVTATHNTYATLDSTDIASLLGAVRASAIPNASWFCSNICFANTFCRLSGTAGGGYLETGMVDGVMTPFYLGFPVILTQKMSQSTSSLSGSMMLAFGDMYAGAVLGQRRGITIARSEDRYMDVDQIAILGTERFHSVIHDLGSTTEFGSLAALIGS